MTAVTPKSKNELGFQNKQRQKVNAFPSNSIIDWFVYAWCADQKKIQDQTSND